MAKRRGNGEGSIRKRNDSRREGRYSAGTDPVTGKALSRNVLGKTQAEVREKLKTAIMEAEGLDLQRTEQFTVAHGYGCGSRPTPSPMYGNQPPCITKTTSSNTSFPAG
jgi:hypothetical protein